MTRPQTERCGHEKRKREGDLSNWSGYTARRMAPSRPLERPGWRGFVPRRRELVFCSAMGKNLAGTLMSGEKPGEKMGPIVLCRWWERGDTGHSSQEKEDGKDRTRQWRTKKRGMNESVSKKAASLRHRQDETGTGEREGRCSKVVRGKGVRKWKRKKGREKVRRMETGRGLCVERSG